MREFPTSIDNGNALHEHKTLLESLEGIVGVTEIKSNVHLDSIWLTFGEKAERVNVEISFEKKHGTEKFIIENITASVEGKGIGKAAVGAILSWATAKGYECIVARDVTPGREGFWEKLDFIEDTEEGHEYRDWRYNK